MQPLAAVFGAKVKGLNEEVAKLEEQSRIRSTTQGPVLTESVYEWSITAVECFLHERKNRSASVSKTDQKKGGVSSCYNLIMCDVKFRL